MPAKRTAELTVFFRQFVDHFETTGAISPSSRWLARSLARFVGGEEGDQPPQRILEVGPGTGAVTRGVIARMRPEDRLDLVELNASFVKLLRDQLATDDRYRKVADRVRVLHMAVQDLPVDEPYDVIVSGLPFNNFPATLVDEILVALAKQGRPGGVLSFFEYAAVRPTRGMISLPADRKRLKAVGRVLKQFLGTHEFRREIVWRNFPPAWVHHARWPEPRGEGAG